MKQSLLDRVLAGKFLDLALEPEVIDLPFLVLADVLQRLRPAPARKLLEPVGGTVDLIWV
jgi:hypothetical protein